jgi:hypothetical protein
MRRRLGTFFIYVGVFLFGLFVLSDQMQAANYRYLLFGILVILLGMFLHLTSPKLPPPPDSGRFRLFKREKKAPK